VLCAGCYDFNADLDAYCAQGHLNCPLPCPDGGICTLAAHQASVYDLTLHGGSLYWAQSTQKGSVWQKPANGEAIALVSSEVLPISVVADDDSVYWATNSSFTGTINKYALNGGAKTTIAVNQREPCRLRLQDNTLYWTTHPPDAGNTITQLALPDGQPQVVADGFTSLCRFETAPDGLYWADDVKDGGIFSLAAGRSPMELGRPSDLVTAVVTDSTYLYWTVFAQSGAVWRSLKDGSEPMQLVGNQPSPATAVTDGQFVYFGSYLDDGQVLKVSVNGGDAMVVASKQVQPLVHAVDDQFVYWSNLDADGGIFRAPK
jgi:hypothetical protein